MLRSFLIAALLLLSACRETPDTPLRMAINPWPGYEFLYLAERLKLFEAEGVNVRILQFSSLNDARRAYEQGKVDGFGGTLIEVLMARQNSPRQPRLVYLPDYSNGGDLIIGQRELADLKALAGKRVAIEPGTLNTYILSRALQRHGLALPQVSLVAMPQAEMAYALESGQIDAAVTYPPFSVAMLKSPKVKRLFDTREIPGEVLDVLVVDASTLEARPEDVARMLRAFTRAIDYSREHPKEAYTIMAEREGLSLEDFQAAIEQDLHILGAQEQAQFYGPEQRLLKALQSTQQVLLDSGALTAEQDLPSLIVTPR